MKQIGGKQHCKKGRDPVDVFFQGCLLYEIVSINHVNFVAVVYAVKQNSEFCEKIQEQ